MFRFIIGKSSSMFNRKSRLLEQPFYIVCRFSGNINKRVMSQLSNMHEIFGIDITHNFLPCKWNVEGFCETKNTAEIICCLQDPIKQPLLKRLAGQEELAQKATQTFLDILAIIFVTTWRVLLYLRYFWPHRILWMIWKPYIRAFIFNQ